MKNKFNVTIFCDKFLKFNNLYDFIRACNASSNQHRCIINFITPLLHIILLDVKIIKQPITNNPNTCMTSENDIIRVTLYNQKCLHYKILAVIF